MLMRISLGNLATPGRQSSSLSSSATLESCMRSVLGTPTDDWESLPAWKKSDSSLSAGMGEFVDEEDRESSVPMTGGVVSRLAEESAAMTWIEGVESLMAIGGGEMRETKKGNGGKPSRMRPKRRRRFASRPSTDE